MFPYVSRHPVLACGALAALLLALTIELVALPSQASPGGQPHTSLALAAGRASFASGGHPRRQGQGLGSGLFDQSIRVPSWAEIDASLARHARGSHGSAGSAGGGDGDANGDGALQAAQWFQQQRAYPLAAIPMGAHDHALSQAATLRRATSLGHVSGQPDSGSLAVSASAAWQHVGDPGQQTGGSATTNFGGGPVHPRNNGVVGGRVTALALAMDPTTAGTIYAGTALGGIWKTTDGGQTWAPKTDNQASLAIGALAIDPATPRICTRRWARARTPTADSHS